MDLVGHGGRKGSGGVDNSLHGGGGKSEHLKGFDGGVAPRFTEHLRWTGFPLICRAARRAPLRRGQ